MPKWLSAFAEPKKEKRAFLELIFFFFLDVSGWFELQAQIEPDMLNVPADNKFKIRDWENVHTGPF